MALPPKHRPGTVVSETADLMVEPSVADRLRDVHPQSLRATLDGRDAEGEGLRKHFADDQRRAVGRDVERAIVLMGITKQEAAFRMRYDDSGVVSRWCSGRERPLFDKLYALKGFKAAWVIAIAEQTPELEAETFVRVRREIA